MKFETRIGNDDKMAFVSIAPNYDEDFNSDSLDINVADSNHKKLIFLDIYVSPWNGEIMLKIHKNRDDGGCDLLNEYELGKAGKP